MISKADFVKTRVEPLLPDDVHERPWSSSAGLYLDYRIDGELVDQWIAIGGDGHSVETLCQLVLMATQDERHAVPVVVTPSGHGEQVAVRVYRQRGVVVRELEIHPPDFPATSAQARIREQRIEDDVS